MKKLVLCISMGLVCMGLCACEGTGFDPAALEEATKSIQEASQTIEQVTASIDEMEKTVGQITDAMQQGIDSTNAAVDWYQNDAIPENPWINPPITEEEVENAINAGAEGLNYLVDSYVDKNARYDALSEEDIKFFTDYFADPDNNRCLLSTYETPEEYDPDKSVGYEDLTCSGGFYYNNIYLVIMAKNGNDLPFAACALSRDDDDSIMIYANYWSDDMDGIDYSGSFIYYLYDKVLESDVKAVMSIPGKDGDISLGSVYEAVHGKDGLIDKGMKLVSGKKDEVKTYVQAYKGYDVYYSNLDPKAAGEFIVSQIDVTGGDFKTAEGVGIGTDIDTLKEIYGDGIEARIAGGKKQLVYEMGKYNMLFIINKAGKVGEMNIFLADNAFGE